MDNSVRVYHLRGKQDYDPKSNAKRLVATIAVEDHGEERLVTVALCSRKDIPSRKVGRAIALGRLKENDLTKKHRLIFKSEQAFMDWLEVRGPNMHYVNLARSIVADLDVDAASWEN
jgi:hypothetical protein